MINKHREENRLWRLLADMWELEPHNNNKALVIGMMCTFVSFELSVPLYCFIKQEYYSTNRLKIRPASNWKIFKNYKWRTKR
jgi:hypothetical protein